MAQRKGRLVIIPPDFNLCRHIEEGIEDEKQGVEYWTKLGRALESIDSHDTAKAELFGEDERNHSWMLQRIHKKYCG